MGSNKSIRFSASAPGSDTTDPNNPVPIYGTNVEIDSAHLLFGVGGNSSSTALKLTKDYMILTAGASETITDVGNEGLTATNTLTGLELRPNRVALATTNDSTKTLMLMDPSGFFVGNSTITTNANDETTVTPTNSYVTISSDGVTIGGNSNLNVNTNNFVINSDAAANTSMFRLGTSSSPALEYKNGALNITGDIIANSFRLAQDAVVEGLDVAFTSGTRSHTIATSTTGQQQTVTVTVNTAELIASKGALVLGADKGLYILENTDSNTTLNDSIVAINSEGFRMDYSANEYIHLDDGGIDVHGRSITINGEDVWSRGDIIYYATDSYTKVPNHPTDRDWVWIQPVDTVTLSATKSLGSSNTLYAITLGSKYSFSFDDKLTTNSTKVSIKCTMWVYTNSSMKSNGKVTATIHLYSNSGTDLASFTFSNVTSYRKASASDATGYSKTTTLSSTNAFSAENFKFAFTSLSITPTTDGSSSMEYNTHITKVRFIISRYGTSGGLTPCNVYYIDL